MRRLAGVDALFLYSETQTQHMHTLKVGIVDPSSDPDGYSFERDKEKQDANANHDPSHSIASNQTRRFLVFWIVTQPAGQPKRGGGR